MSTPKEPKPARLVVSCLAPDRDVANQALQELIKEFGPIESEFGPLPFPYSSYYEDELGPQPWRRIWEFRNLAPREDLARIKLLTNGVETAHGRNGKRIFNLDPGFLTLDNFVLATGKGRPHRVYLRDGVFADITLIFVRGAFTATPWTYPDYASHEIIEIMNHLRKRYKTLLRESERNERNQKHDRLRPGRAQ
jgi:hypothetical protein